MRMILSSDAGLSRQSKEPGRHASGVQPNLIDLARGPAWWTALVAAVGLLVAQIGAGLFGAVIVLDRLGGLCQGLAACDPWPGRSDLLTVLAGGLLLSISFPIAGAFYSLARGLWRQRFFAMWAGRIAGWVAAVAGVIGLLFTPWAAAWAVFGLVLAIAAKRIGFRQRGVVDV